MIASSAFEVMGPFAAISLAAVFIVTMRLRGVLTDEIIADLQQPFSRSTLAVVAMILAAVQLIWVASAGM